MSAELARSIVGSALLAAADVGVLVGCRTDAAHTASHLHAPAAWIADAGSDVAAAQAAGAVLWVIALWLAVGMGAAFAQHLPGRLGRAADAVARSVLPGAVYRVVAGAAGLGIVLAPAIATGVEAAAAQPAAASTVTPPAWPTDSSLPAPVWPTDPSIAAHHRRATPQAGDEDVVVHAGDSLWSIAAEHLPAHASDARIAKEWPRWFAANHRVIGTDPNTITPGQLLHAPEEGSS